MTRPLGRPSRRWSNVSDVFRRLVQKGRKERVPAETLGNNIFVSVEVLLL